MVKLLPANAAETRRWVTPEPLNVAPALVGLPLATPARRALAIIIDLIVVALLSGVSAAWLLGGLALVVLQLRSRRGAITGPRMAIGWIGAVLIGLLALNEAQDQWSHWRDNRHGPRSESPAAGAGEHAEAAQALEEVATEIAADSPAAAAAVRQARSQLLATSASAASAPARTDAQRIAELEMQLAQARQPRSIKPAELLSHALDEIGAGLGWGIVYFSLLPAWWGGQTVGKKLLRLRVVELTGKPMTVMRCLKRYGGYAAGVATGGIGLAQVLWDVNRQGLQDKAAHTVVIDLRAAPPVPVPAPPAPPTPPAAV